jgi:beta-lactam-binding protein with PASTA domain/predicted Ser/Thr protein kinase
MDERLQAETIVDARYRILNRLGSGGMADVYCAQDLQLGRNVALKLLYRRFAEDEEFVERFRREASSAAGLQHQHVVSVYDRGEWDGTYYIAMEFLEGRNLKQVIQQEAPLAPGRAIDIVIQVLKAARFAHRRGVIHRDLKPHNVILDDEERAKVTDFGIARAGASDMTQTGSIMGTAQYLSPEQAQGHAVSEPSDLYSIGIILYELVAGRLPFDGESAVAIALKQVSETPVAPSTFNAAVPPELDAAVMRALEKDPAKRFADADEFIASLEAIRSRLPLNTPAIPVPVDDEITTISGPPTEELTAAPVRPLPVLSPYDAYTYPSEPPPPHEPGDHRGWWWALGIGLLITAAVVAGLLLFGGTKVTVPTVVGAPQADAETRLHHDGFKTEAIRKTSTSEEGAVIGQDPAGGDRAKKGSTVTLVVSSGPGKTVVPSVDGLGKRAATRELEDAGFEVQEEPKASDSVGKDHVISTSPANGQVIDKGSTVTIFVSTGPEKAVVPDVTGSTVDDATAAIEDAGFDPRIHEEESGKPEGTVLSQDPAGGAQAPKGSKVTLTVAKQPEQIEVPDVTGENQSAATEELSGAGFKVKIVSQAVDNPEDDGIVIDQDPLAGDKIKRGDRVTITVGHYTPAASPEPGPPGTNTTPQ